MSSKPRPSGILEGSAQSAEELYNWHAPVLEHSRSWPHDALAAQKTPTDIKPTPRMRGCASPAISSVSLDRGLSERRAMPMNPLLCSRCIYPVCAAQVLGRKGEDTAVVDDCTDNPDADVLLAVFDGHRSRDVALHAANRLPAMVLESALWPKWPAQALCGGISACHESARQAGLSGGTTAVVVAVTDRSLWCGNVGDSRATAGLADGGCRRLSVDHTACSPSEVARVEAMGGSILLGRLGAMLQVTRGIGDFDFEEEGFACAADVSTCPLDDIEFVVLASDGLWNYVDDETCCQLVRESARDESALRLASEAVELGSDDDITVIVAFFPRDSSNAAAVRSY